MHFFFDLDGPLLNVSEKFYKTYSDILYSESFVVLDKFLYWELKRNKTQEREIHSITHAFVPDFSSRRKSIIETDDYQKLDTLQPFTKDVLALAKSKGAVYLVTLRHSREHVLKQLSNNGILSFFDEILTSGEETSPTWKVKYGLLDNHFGGNIPSKSLFIGDTETDILAGKSIGSRTIAVLNGMRNYEKIKQCNPDHIVPSISDLLHLNLI